MPRTYQPKLKRTEIRLPAWHHDQIQTLAKSSGYSIATLIRFTLTTENLNRAIAQLKLSSEKAGQ